MPYQFDPSAAKVSMSKRFATAVMVGAVLPTNLTPVNVAVLVPAPVFKNKINDLPAVLLGIVNVHVADKLAVMMVLFAMFKVNALPVFTYPVVMPSVYALNCELTNVELLIVTPLADPLIIVTFVLVSPLAVPPLIVTVFKVTLLNVEAFDVTLFMLPLVILTFVNVDALEVTLFMLPLIMLTFVNVSAFAVPPVIVTLLNVDAFDVTLFIFPLVILTFVNVDAFDVTPFILPLVITTFVNVSAFAVPPLMVTLLSEDTKVITSLMFVPLLNTIVLLPAGRVNAVPVGEAFVPLEIMIELDRPFVTRYCFSIAGTNNVCTLEIVPTKLSRRLRAVCAALVSVNAIATFALAKVTLEEPVIASSMAVPRLVFVVLPHVPA